jgi:subtilisin family serine protease
MKNFKRVIIVCAVLISVGLCYTYYSHKDNALSTADASNGMGSKKKLRAKSILPSSKLAATGGADNDSYPTNDSPDSAQNNASTNDHDEGSRTKPYLSEEQLFINGLLQKTPMQTADWHDIDEKQYVKATLVDNHSIDKNIYIVRELFKDEAHQVPHYRTVQIANNLIASFHDGVRSTDRDQFLKDNNLRIAYSYSLPNMHLLQWDDISLEKMRAISKLLNSSTLTRYGDANYMAFVSKLPNDPDAKTKAWHLLNSGKNPKGAAPAFTPGDDTHIEQSWDKITDCSNIVIAIIDSGVDFNHPDLKANILMDKGRSFHPDHVNDFSDTMGHGTHVAGTIGAVGGNGIGSSGMCWKAKIIPLRVFAASGPSSQDIIVRAVLHAGSSEAKIINMSLGGAGPMSKAYDDAFKVGTDAGKLFFVSAGNENLNIDTSPVSPASSTNPNVITVAAYQGDGKISSFSNFGSRGVDIAAPGSDIWATYPLAKGNYAFLSGTSMASPVAAGAAALLWSYAPSLSSTQVRNAILENADVGTSFGNSKPIVENRKLNVTKVLLAFAPKAEMTNLKADQIVKLEGNDQFEVAVGVTEKYSKVDKIEVLQGDQILGTATGMAQKIPITLPTGMNTAAIRIRVTDKDGHVSEGAPLNVKIALSKSLKFSAIKIDEFLGDVKCALTQTSPTGTSITLYEASVISKGFCNRLCGIIAPLADSTTDKISCESTAKASDSEAEVKE